jgi:DNA-binding GntR family transcriptional regulator
MYVAVVTGDRSELDRDGNVPAYLQLAQLLRQAITAGRIRPGVMLPSQNELSAGYGVSVETARRAVQVLREEGLVVTRRGAGSFAAVPPPRITVAAGADDVVTARMPTRAERGALGLAEGVPVISVRRPGRAEELFDANRAEVIIGLTAPERR